MPVFYIVKQVSYVINIFSEVYDWKAFAETNCTEVFSTDRSHQNWTENQLLETSFVSIVRVNVKPADRARVCLRNVAYSSTLSPLTKKILILSSDNWCQIWASELDHFKATFYWAGDYLYFKPPVQNWPCGQVDASFPLHCRFIRYLQINHKNVKYS
jgi:hypothetical protein